MKNVPLDRKPKIALLTGDPSGIGPEITAKLLALRETRTAADVILIGALDPPESIPRGRVSREAGAYTLGQLREGVAMLQAGTADAMVFAPLNKQAMKLAGMPFSDELHLFASLLGFGGPVSEINVMGNLWTSRVTSHVALREVASLITRERIHDAVHLLHHALRASGAAVPRLAVAALNPHAGEGGTLGTEEIDTIGPALEELRGAGMEIAGPLPSDTLFLAAVRGDFDGVITMYHDQGQIALKLMGFNRGVTVAGGLPVVITTPAHGTAFDIVGKDKADVGPLREAFRIACRMAAARL
ncbi:MAG: 4-hydroxythreonine-4-phosphate dehydrogenase PdxA [Bryobacterales bacterium]|nr:4-hydroxythreonine-4-phosphate dehydrogenase PdxA [Bryobacterales bacterium]